eukprot:2423030-Ditylum_brightwellii.AAC.1
MALYWYMHGEEDYLHKLFSLSRRQANDPTTKIQHHMVHSKHMHSEGVYTHQCPFLSMHQSNLVTLKIQYLTVPNGRMLSAEVYTRHDEFLLVTNQANHLLRVTPPPMVLHEDRQSVEV